jgi:hypothetical protein
MSDLIKRVISVSQLPDKAISFLANQGYGDIQAGDYYISRDYVVKVIGFYIEETPKGQNDDLSYRLKVIYKQAKDFMCTTWKEQQTTGWSDFVRSYGENKIPDDMSPTEYMKLAQGAVAGEVDLSQFNVDNQNEAMSSETALISKGSKEGLIRVKQDLEQRKARAEALTAFVNRELERKKREIDQIRYKLEGYIANIKRVVSRVMNVIHTIELYLGIDEEIFQIQEGEKASADEPISFRQQVLYMDEEVAVYDEGGLDFKDISVFDEWLLKDDHYKILVPEQKCIVVFQPRRYYKDYGKEDYRISSAKNEANLRSSYILIRNGDNLYRIFTEKIFIPDCLFPKRNELQDIMEKMSKVVDENSAWASREIESKEKTETILGEFKKRAVMMQGLIDRTEILHPLPDGKVSMFNLDASGDKIRFIYDAEAMLPSGRKTFAEWKKEINDKIDVGSRVLITGHYGSGYSRSGSEYSNRYYRYYRNDASYPTLPHRGVYEVQKHIVTNTEWFRENDYLKKKEDWDKWGLEYKIIKTD